MMTLLEAVHTFTATGSLWNAATWLAKLGHKLPLFHWSAPSHPVYLPHDDAAFIDDPQAMFSSMDAVDLLEAAIGDTPPVLSSSSQVVPLQLSSSSSDALRSSSVITFNIADHDPPTEDEQPKKEKGAAHENGSSQSQNSLGRWKGRLGGGLGEGELVNPVLPILLSLLMSLLAARRWTLRLQPRSLMIIFVLLIVLTLLALDVTLPPLQLTMRVCKLQFVYSLITDLQRLVRGQM